MPDTIEPSPRGDGERSLALRLAWFFGIAACSAGAVIAAAYLLRALLR